jgi:hypothetical protein
MLAIVGFAFTVKTVVTWQPPGTEYVTREVPVANPVTAPLDALTMATGIFPVVQVPPVVEFANVAVPPIHADAVPVIAGGVVHEGCIITL